MEVNEAAPKYYPKMSPFEFLEWERKQEFKHEYVNGEILAMAGASFKHSLIASNIIGLVGTFLRGKQCNILPGDLRVSVKFKNSFFYPDATIVCNEPEFDDEKIKDTLKNPVVIFEILSPSTEDYDMGRKQMHYMQIESLKQYILINSQIVHVRAITKQEKGTWKFTELTSSQDKIFIESINFETTVADLYEGVKF
jgi:Uma2 family endonuclease